MKAIKIYTQDSKYFMEDLDTNTTVELTEIVDNGKTLKLPENSANRKYCSIEKALKSITLDHKETMTLNKTKSTTKSSKISLSEYYTESEKTKIEELQRQIDEINEAAMERAKKDIKMNELRTTLKNLDHETLAKLIEELR